MNLIDPIMMSQDKIVNGSYNVVQDIAIWSSTTTYSKGQQVVLNAWGAITCESLIDNNGNQHPATTPTAWLKKGASNYAAMFDSVNGTKTKRLDNIQLTVQTSELITAIGLVGLDASSVRVVMTDTTYNQGVVYDKTISLKTLPAYDWYTFIFAEFVKESVAIFDDLPPYRNAQITITINSYATGNYAEVGTIQLGKLEKIGLSKYGFKSNFIDYSIKEADEFGNFTIVKRVNAETLEASVEVDTYRLSSIKRLREKLSATPIIWIGSKHHSITTGFGFFDQFDLGLSNQIKSDASIRVVTLT